MGNAATSGSYANASESSQLNRRRVVSKRRGRIEDRYDVLRAED